MPPRIHRAGSIIWIVCFSYSVTSALGVAVEDRSTRTGGRETIVMNYEETITEVGRLEKRRAGLRAHRTAAELEAAIKALLLRPVESNQRIRGTVGEISNNCQRVASRTTEACAEVSQLREELAAANEERDLDRRLSELTDQARQLRERGATKATDPQAELLARLSGGRLSPRDVGPGLSLLLAMTIELVSAFGPTVLSNYADATKGNDRTGGKRIGLVIDYLSDRIEPAANTETLSESALYTDYAAWCHASDRVALAIAGICGRVRSAARGKRARENPQAQGSLLRHPPRHLLRKTAATVDDVAATCPVAALSPPVAACPAGARQVEPHPTPPR